MHVVQHCPGHCTVKGVHHSPLAELGHTVFAVLYAQFAPHPVHPRGVSAAGRVRDEPNHQYQSYHHTTILPKLT